MSVFTYPLLPLTPTRSVRTRQSLSKLTSSWGLAKLSLRQRDFCVWFFQILKHLRNTENNFQREEYSEYFGYSGYFGENQGLSISICGEIEEASLSNPCVAKVKNIQTHVCHCAVKTFMGYKVSF